MNKEYKDTALVIYVFFVIFLHMGEFCHLSFYLAGFSVYFRF